MNLARAALLVAARAARRWPPGRSQKAWFREDGLEALILEPAIPLAVARRAGDPAVCVAALRAHLAGRDSIPWREVFVAQEQLIALLDARGVRGYNRILSREPDRVAALLESLAKELTDGRA